MVGVGFTSTPTIQEGLLKGQTLIWSEDNQSLTITPQNRQIDFFSNHVQFTNQRPNALQANQAASNFAKKLGISEQISTQILQSQTTSNSHEFEYIPQTTQNTIQVALNFTLNELNIVETQPNLSTNKVFVNNDYKITSATITLPPKKITSLGNYPLKNLPQIKNAISTQAFVSQILTDPKLPTPSIDELSNINISQIELAYYQPEQSDTYLHPIFILKGSTQTSPNAHSDITLYLPALSDQALQKDN